MNMCVGNDKSCPGVIVLQEADDSNVVLAKDTVGYRAREKARALLKETPVVWASEGPYHPSDEPTMRRSLHVSMRLGF